MSARRKCLVLPGVGGQNAIIPPIALVSDQKRVLPLLWPANAGFSQLLATSGPGPAPVVKTRYQLPVDEEEKAAVDPKRSLECASCFTPRGQVVKRSRWELCTKTKLVILNQAALAEEGDGVLRRVGAFSLAAVAIEVLLAVAFLLTGADAMIEQGLSGVGLEFNTDLVTAVTLVVGFPAAAFAVGLSLMQVAAPDLAVLAVPWPRGGQEGRRPVRERLRFWSCEDGARSGIRTWALMITVFLTMNLATAGLNSLLLSTPSSSGDRTGVRLGSWPRSW